MPRGDATETEPNSAALQTIHAMVVARGEEPDKCILYPTDRPSDGIVFSQWISAEGDDFVDLDEMR
jgi:hypothetical protein